MAAITTSSAMISAPTLCVSAAGGRTNRRRHIDPKTGHALEILGHAIEYLTDEFVHEAATFSAGNEKLKAVQLLMTLNRQVYFGCPLAPTLGERCGFFLRACFG